MCLEKNALLKIKVFISELLSWLICYVYRVKQVVRRNLYVTVAVDNKPSNHKRKYLLGREIEREITLTDQYLCLF